MDIIVRKSAKICNTLAAKIVASVVREKRNAVLCLPAGNTPRGLYDNLILKHSKDGLDFGDVSVFALDEYLGIAPNHPQSFCRYLQDRFISKVNIPSTNVHFLDGLTPDVQKTCLDYERSIREIGGIDLVVLGIGANGHIGFNEPGSSPEARTQVTALTAHTRKQNAKEFGQIKNVPTHALTVGIGTIMESRRLLLLAFGKGKAQAIQKALEEPITPMVPASALQRHRNITVLVDPGAASELKSPLGS